MTAIDAHATREVPTGTPARILKLEGTYDATDARVASACALDILREGCRDLLLDLRDSELTATGLILLLLRPAHWMRRRHGRLRVRVPADRSLDQALATTGLAERVEVER